MILQPISALLATKDSVSIVSAIKAAIERTDDAPFWKQKTPLLVEAILSVLIPLREQKLLFDPEGNHKEALDAELLLRWCDLMSLRGLAFTLAKSNDANELLKLKFTADGYKPIDLETLGKYLSSYSVDLTNEMVDFPVSNYNLHIGMASLLERVLKD